MFYKSVKVKPKIKTVKIFPGEQILEVIPGQTILESAIDAGIHLPYSCGVGSCKSCMVALEQGKVKPLVDFDYILEQEEIDKNYILCCQSLVEEDSVIRLINE